MIYGSKIFNFCNDLYFLPSFPFTPISPISNCWQQNICGSLCSWMTKCYICFRYLPEAEVFGKSIWQNSNRFRLWCWFKLSILPIFSKTIFNGYWLSFNQNSAQATWQVFYILTFGLPYARHYNLRFVSFYPIFQCGL